LIFTKFIYKHLRFRGVEECNLRSPKRPQLPPHKTPSFPVTSPGGLTDDDNHNHSHNLQKASAHSCFEAGGALIMVAPIQLSHAGLRVSPSVRREIERHPDLDVETEKRLLLAAQSGDIAARQKLIKHNLAFICRVGGVYRNKKANSILLDDDVLLNQGVLGLNHAIDQWSTEGGARLCTFAYWKIRKAMQSDDGLYADEAIRVPESARNQLKKINQVQQDELVSTEEIAKQTHLKVERVEVLVQIHQPSSLDVPADDLRSELIDIIADPTTEELSDAQNLLSSIPLGIADAIREKRWEDLLALIPSQLAAVIRLRFFEGKTLQAICKQLSIPIRQIKGVLQQALDSLQIQIKGFPLLALPVTVVPTTKKTIEPIGNGEQLSLELPFAQVVETGHKLLTRSIGFGVQLVKKTKQAAQKAAQILGYPLKVFTQSQSIQAEPTTHSVATSTGSPDSTSASVATSIVFFGTACNNVVDFDRRPSRGSVSLGFYSQKEFDSGGLPMIRDLFIFFLGLLVSSALHVSGVVDASRWGRIINQEQVSDIADDVGDAVKVKLKK
jgi:RNA polymerase sigma factor (sigma-70 family)